ncbi:hypothetical protein BS47DRAFT_1349167 [Hydnum rufescens UP504]|uniref:Uncharacterized protein n=1 Tax=Hydnum rufescens UP504 TaxID=1448309 RepID=A0A9P6DSH4_9AGAM|nr:hypothetical protein BS47DRAFT_1349167 [Hydnum rufescens UP504]
MPEYDATYGSGQHLCNGIDWAYSSGCIPCGLLAGQEPEPGDPSCEQVVKVMMFLMVNG